MDEKPKRGRPAKDDAKVVVTLRLRPAVIAAYEALGPDWRARMEIALVAGLDTGLRDAPAPRDGPDAIFAAGTHWDEGAVSKVRKPTTKFVANRIEPLKVSVPLIERKAFNPQPKKGKTK